jgi:adiponectin receptor
MIHGIIKYGWALQSQRMGLKWVLATLGLNSLGALAYAIKVGFYFHVSIIPLLQEY